MKRVKIHLKLTNIYIYISFIVHISSLNMALTEYEKMIMSHIIFVVLLERRDQLQTLSPEEKHCQYNTD